MEDLYYQIIIIVFGVLVAYFAYGLTKAKVLASKIAAFLKETSETLELIGQSIEDDKLTKEELSAIAIQAQENLATARALINEIRNLAGIISSFIKK